MEYHLGMGALNWSKDERISDRYGTVSLSDSGWLGQKIEDNSFMNSDVIEKLCGKKGKLVANVIKTRKSKHIGDITRKIYPSMPGVGEIIVLGEGTFFKEAYDEMEFGVGVIPYDKRSNDWLDPRQLYRVHQQTVNLYFVTDEKATRIEDTFSAKGTKMIGNGPEISADRRSLMLYQFASGADCFQIAGCSSASMLLENKEE